MTQKNTKPKHGGKRPGAGRKAPEGARPLLQTRVAVATMAKLKAKATGGKSIGRVIDDIVSKTP